MNWLPLVAVISLCYGAYNFFIKSSAEYLHQIMGAVILQAVALSLGCAALGWLKLQGTPVSITPTGLRYAIFAGIAVGLAEVLSFYFYSMGVSASIGIPTIVGGTVIVGSLLGVTFLREQVGLTQWLGICFVVMGVVLLSKPS